jgi:hypothetical protein
MKVIAIHTCYSGRPDEHPDEKLAIRIIRYRPPESAYAYGDG